MRLTLLLVCLICGGELDLLRYLSECLRTRAFVRDHALKKWGSGVKCLSGKGCGRKGNWSRAVLIGVKLLFCKVYVFFVC